MATFHILSDTDIDPVACERCEIERRTGPKLCASCRTLVRDVCVVALQQQRSDALRNAWPNETHASALTRAVKEVARWAPDLAVPDDWIEPVLAPVEPSPAPTPKKTTRKRSTFSAWKSDA